MAKKLASSSGAWLWASLLPSSCYWVSVTLRPTSFWDLGETASKIALKLWVQLRRKFKSSASYKAQL